jgi:hypothetical protein
VKVPNKKLIIGTENPNLICEGTGGQNGAIVKAAKSPMKKFGELNYFGENKLPSFCSYRSAPFEENQN